MRECYRAYRGPTWFVMVGGLVIGSLTGYYDWSVGAFYGATFALSIVFFGLVLYADLTYDGEDRP